MDRERDGEAGRAVGRGQRPVQLAQVRRLHPVGKGFAPRHHGEIAQARLVQVRPQRAGRRPVLPPERLGLFQGGRLQAGLGLGHRQVGQLPAQQQHRLVVIDVGDAGVGDAFFPQPQVHVAVQVLGQGGHQPGHQAQVLERPFADQDVAGAGLQRARPARDHPQVAVGLAQAVALGAHHRAQQLQIGDLDPAGVQHGRLGQEVPVLIGVGGHQHHQVAGVGGAAFQPLIDRHQIVDAHRIVGVGIDEERHDPRLAGARVLAAGNQLQLACPPDTAAGSLGQVQVGGEVQVAQVREAVKKLQVQRVPGRVLERARAVQRGRRRPPGHRAQVLDRPAFALQCREVLGAIQPFQPGRSAAGIPVGGGFGPGVIGSAPVGPGGAGILVAAAHRCRDQNRGHGGRRTGPNGRTRTRRWS